MKLEIEFKPRTTAWLLAIIAIYLAAQSIFGEYIQGTILSTKLGSVPAQLFDLFSVNAEQTIPTWYSVCLLLAASVLLFMIAIAKYRVQDRYRFHWIGLALIFLYLSMDEGAVIHEIAADGLQAAFNTSGFLLFGWQIIALPLIIVFVLAYLRFLFHLPASTRNRFIASGALYVGGAIFIEAISANQLSIDRAITIPYLAIGTVEELCEMLGVVFFIYTLLRYMADIQYSVTIQPHLREDTSEKPDLLRGLVLSKWAVIIAVLVIAMNAGLLYWGQNQPSSGDAANEAPTSVLQLLVDELPAEGSQVTNLKGSFSFENLTARQFAASLLALYSQVMVVSLPGSQSSIMIAADTLPFDREKLADILHTNGETQFIIYDTTTVKAIVGDVGPITGN